jgi:hypothetical protein
MTEVKHAEPPSWSQSPLFMIGQDDRGNWIAQDLKGICGGLFVTRDAAMRFVRSENGHRPQAVVLVSGVLELDMTREPSRPFRQDPAADTQPLRRTA